MGGRRALLAVLVVLGLASPAWADMGVPMLLVVWPAAWVLLAPIIVVEWHVARRVGPVEKKLRGVVWANVVSALVGVPVTWYLLLLIEMVSGGGAGFGHGPAEKPLMITIGAPWLPPSDSDLDWMVPAAALFLLIPFFFMSVAIEAPVFRRVTDCPRDLAWRWSWRANLASYGCLFVLVAGLLVYALATHGRG